MFINFIQLYHNIEVKNITSFMIMNIYIKLQQLIIPMNNLLLLFHDNNCKSSQQILIMLDN